MKEETGYRGYFIYKGVAYGKGTKVLFTEKVYNKPHFNIKHKDKPHTFIWGSKDGYLGFAWIHKGGPKYGRSDVGVYNPDEEIAEIVDPVYVEPISWKKQAMNNMLSEDVHPPIFGGVLIYVVIMLVGAIFNSRWLIWIFGTAIFIWWLLNQYRTT